MLNSLAKPEAEAARLARSVAEKIRSILSIPFLSQGGGYLLGAGIGITLFANGGDTATELLSRRIPRWDQAKADGRNCIRFSSLLANLRERPVWCWRENCVVRWCGDDLRLYLQPQVNTGWSDYGR